MSTICASISVLHIQAKRFPHGENWRCQMKLPYPVLSAIKLYKVGTSSKTACSSIAR